jgi:hypothetical protein
MSGCPLLKIRMPQAVRPTQAPARFGALLGHAAQKQMLKTTTAVRPNYDQVGIPALRFFNHHLANPPNFLEKRGLGLDTSAARLCACLVQYLLTGLAPRLSYRLHIDPFRRSYPDICVLDHVDDP